MIVAAYQQHASVGMCALEVRVFQRVAGPIDTRAFAIPDSKDTVDFFARQKIDLLRSPYGGRRLVFSPAGTGCRWPASVATPATMTGRIHPVEIRGNRK